MSVQTKKLSDHIELHRPFYHVAFAEPISRMLHLLPYPFFTISDAQYFLDVIKKSPRFSQLQLFVICYDNE